MFFNSGDLGYQGINETVDLGFDGSQEGFVLHQIEGFGEYPKGRQNYDCKIGVDLDVVRSIEKVYRTLERGDMEDRFHSMRLEGSDLWSKEVKGMILSNTNTDPNLFESEAKVSLGCRYCMVGRRILHQWFTEITSYQLGGSLRIFMIDQKIFVYDMEGLLLTIYWKSEKHKKAVVLRSQGQLVVKVGSKNGLENNIKKLKIYVPHFDNSANEMVSVVFFSATRRELGLGLLGQVIVLLALQLVPLNQLQRAGLELDKVFRLFIMGKRSEERVWSRVYSAVRGHILAFVCEIGISAGFGKAKDLAEPRIFLWINMFFFWWTGESIYVIFMPMYAGQWYSCFGMEDRGAETRWCQSKKKLDGDLVSYQGYYSSEVA
ncbi:hypothetical protein DY000_02049724 [Brassica cretica]|uniref:Uncharacterized protein n=1 Tax=Brassica cretica TaxID=69181 RepID=A0ABQ7F687_BRACR|nr:hypothetical protein DY000_02049724 [Brassica cretica]